MGLRPTESDETRAPAVHTWGRPSEARQLEEFRQSLSKDAPTCPVKRSSPNLSITPAPMLSLYFPYPDPGPALSRDWPQLIPCCALRSWRSFPRSQTTGFPFSPSLVAKNCAPPGAGFPRHHSTHIRAQSLTLWCHRGAHVPGQLPASPEPALDLGGRLPG